MSDYFGKVQINMYASNPAAFCIIDELKIRDKALAWSLAYLKKKYRLNVKMGPGPMRGGGGESLLTFLKHLWDVKDYVTIVSHILVLILKQLRKHIIVSQSKSRPAMVISFDFVVKLDLKDEYSASLVYDSMSSLSFILEDLRKALRNEYPAVVFHSSLGVSTPKRDFTLNWRLEHRQLSVFNMARINSHIQRLNMRTGMKYDYSITAWGAVKREDSKIAMLKGRGAGSYPTSRFKHLYFFISSRTI